MDRRTEGVSDAGEGRWHALLASIADMVTVSDRDGRITYANPATESVSGYTLEEFAAQHPFELMHPEDRPHCEEAFKELVHNPGLSLGLEHRFRHKDGTWRWVEGTFTSLFDDPEVGGLVAAVRDVTERKRRELNDAFLADLLEDFARLSSLDEIMRDAGEKIKRHFGVPRLTFAEVDEAADEVTVIYDNREQDLANAMGTKRLSDYVGEDYLCEMKSGRPIAVNDLNTDPRTAARAEVYKTFRIRAQLMMPHVTEGRLDFVIAMQHRKPYEWRDDEIELLHELAMQVYLRLERARAEEALRASEEKYRTLFDSIDEGFGIIEMLYDDQGRAFDYRILETNPAFGRMTGFADAAGKTSLELNPDAEPYWFETLGRVAQTGEDVRFESYAEALDRWFEVSASRVGGEASRRVAIVFNNTTKRKRAEEALRESQEQLLLATDAARLGRWELLPDTGELLGDDAWKEHHCTQPGVELGYDGHLGVIHPNDHEAVRHGIARALKEEGAYEAEYRVIRPDGEARWILSRGRLIRGSSAPDRLMGVTLDVTERRELEREKARSGALELAARAEEAERRRISRELHDRVAHSMGAAYQSLQLYGDYANKDPSRAAETLELAKESTRRALDQTRSLSMELERSQREEKWNGVVAALCDLLTTEVSPDVKATLSVSGDDSSVPELVGEQVYLVMREAVRNAVEHSGCDRIGMRLEVRGGELYGHVDGDGAGPNPDVEQVYGSTGDEDSLHLGTGLRSTRESAELLGGELLVVSKPGQGMRVEIRVPLG